MKKTLCCLLVCLFFFLSGLTSNSTFARTGTSVYWSEIKEAVYSPLYGNTLPWSDNVMKFGGYDFDASSITAGTEADFVMNIYTDIGARKIAESATFGIAIDVNHISFPKDGFGDFIQSMEMSEGDIFLIEASDKNYFQIRIDRILATSVHFSYVMEQDAPADDPNDFTPMETKYTRDTKKAWTIVLNDEVDFTTVNSNTVSIKDSKGYVFQTTLQLGHDKKRIHIFPVNHYLKDETYTIYVKKDVKNKAGKQLNNGALMSFSFDADEKYPDITSPAQLSGLRSSQSGDILTLSWYSSNANDLAGYHVYYKIEGEKAFVKLNNTVNGGNLFYSSTIELTKGLDHLKGKKAEFYVTAVDKSQNESIPSDLMTLTIMHGGTDPGDKTPPAAPAGVTIKPLNGKVEIDWYDQYEIDLLGYYLYMSEDRENNFKKVTFKMGNSLILDESLVVYDGLTNEKTYHFYVTAVDKSGNESAPSKIVSTTPTAGYTTNWTGGWQSDYGVITFNQTANVVKGIYSYGIMTGTLSGTVEGNTLTGTYYENELSYGEFVFTMSDNGLSFDGKSKISGGLNWSKWNGTKLP